MKKLVLALFALSCFALGEAAFAVSGNQGIGGVAANVTSNMGNIARLITAAAYVAGMAFAIAGLVKLKGHKDAPTQVPISTGIVFIFLGAALLFIPSVFKTSGYTLFGSGQAGSVSGFISFGADKTKG